MGLLGMLAFTLMFGAVLAGIGIYFGYHWWTRREWESFQGRIIEVHSSFKDGGTIFHPVIRVQKNGVDYDFKSDIGTYPAPKVGRKRKVIGNIETNQFSEFSIGIAILTIFLPIALGVGVVALGWSTYQSNQNIEQDVPPKSDRAGG